METRKKKYCFFSSKVIELIRIYFKFVKLAKGHKGVKAQGYKGKKICWL
jgi:hypothetical protein